MQRHILWLVLCLSILISLGPSPAMAASPQSAAGGKSIAGLWETKNAQGNSVLMLNPDGSGEFNGKQLHWKISGNVLSLSFEGGSTYMYETVLAGNSLTVNSADLKQPLHFTRSGSGGGAEQANPVAGGGLAGISGAARPAATKSAGGPEGTWQVQKTNGTFTLVLNPGGGGTFNGDPIKWEFARSILTLRWENGDTFMYNAALSPGSLKVSGGNLSSPIEFQRAGGGATSGLAATSRLRSAGASPVGRWETPTQNGMIQLALNPDGSGTFGAGSVRWVYSQGTLTLTGPNGKPVPYPASIGPDSMTLTDATTGAALTFRKVGGGERASESSGAVESGNEGADGFGDAPGGGSAESLAGTWQNQQGSTLQLNPDGSAILNGQRFRYTSDGSTLTMIGADGQMPFPYSLRGNTLTVQVQGQTAIYTRTPAAGGGRAGGFGGGGGSNPPEMAGKWCAYRESSTGQISSGNEQCFTLYPNGTYEYYGESSSSNQFGSVGSQSGDSGTWTVQGTTLVGNSRTQGRVVYQLEKRNNKNNDPMLCLDGQCFVTYGQKPPWPY